MSLKSMPQLDVAVSLWTQAKRDDTAEDHQIEELVSLPTGF